jgi:hypothetical protein
MKTAPIKTELHFAYFRLFVGALIGFFVFSIIAASMLSPASAQWRFCALTSWFAHAVSRYGAGKQPQDL